uniref:Uncharacterized protein n=1 Tax=Anguilla anguilla TaxID=7936 RepID=A0A0E9U3A2_ANGAN
MSLLRSLWLQSVQHGSAHELHFPGFKTLLTKSLESQWVTSQ